MARQRKLLPRIKRFIRQPKVARYYLFGSAAILFLSTIAWALIGSIGQLGNADQLANSFLAKDPSHSLLPDQHTFLFKLPFFWLVDVMGATPFAFCFVTILVVLLTVGLFAFILYRIEKRPLYIGTVFLALALTLIMIPAQSYAGANLPVNMAMLTTRNLEYILYIAVLMLLISAKRWVSARLIIAAALMILLIASDKLFLSVSLGASVLVIIISFVWKHVPLLLMALKWLVVSIIGAIGATLLLYTLSALHILHSIGQGSIGPYGLVTSFKGLLQAIFYGILSLLTNFGANPGFDGRTPSTVVSFALGRLASPLLIVYLLTLGVFVGIVIAVIRAISDELKKKKLPPQTSLTIALVASAIAAVFLYILANHYYPVDARYVSVAFFAGFVGLVTYGKMLRKQYYGRFAVLGVLLIIGIGVSTFFLVSSYQQQKAATQDIDQRNELIAKALKTHHANTLLGDYWRVFPIKLATPYSEQVVDPLSGCTLSRTTLSSSVWTAGDTSNSFAYLLTLNQTSANFPACTLAQITSAYGRPDSSTVISGTQNNPQELLLFYDKGVHKLKPSTNPTALTDTVLPAPLSSLTNTSCPTTTIMNIIAHQDDDLLFMNPDLIHEIQAGDCIRTVYITAGDAGNDSSYWLSRQQGAEAAYATMFHLTDPVWTERKIGIAPNEIATIANPRGIRSLSLIFMHLPDGSPSGQGFPATHYQSLVKLFSGTIPSITTVDSSSTYTKEALINALVGLMGTYTPSRIQSQSTQAAGRYPDHTDHTTVGHIVQLAVALYKDRSTSPPVSAVYYLGYPIHAKPANVTGADLTAKVNAFTSYSRYDDATCDNLADCDAYSVYGFYLRREYSSTY